MRISPGACDAATRKPWPISYDRFGKVASSAIVAIVRDRGIAEDLVQKLFCASGIASTRLRTARRTRTVAARQRPHGSQHLRAQSSRTPLALFDMERDVLNTDHARIIRNAVAKLSASQQKVIELADYEGLSQTEMAERMGEVAA